jgi:hypothetical protein
MIHGRWIAFALLTIGAVALSKCTAQNEFTGGACSQIATEYDNVLQPMPGATNVPTAPGQLELAEELPVNAAVSLQPSGPGSPIPLGVLPTPAPGATASTAPPPLKFLNYPQLQSATSYTVVYRAISKGPCPPNISSDGTFTTQ